MQVTNQQVLGDAVSVRDALPLLNQYRRIQLQKIMKANGLSYDPVNTTGKQMREILVNHNAKIPSPENFSAFVAQKPAKIKDVEPPPEQKERKTISVSSGRSIDNMNYFQLKKYATDLGMDLTKQTKKDDILRFLNDENAS